MSDETNAARNASGTPETYRAWQLFGAGMENVGRNNAPVTLPLRPPNDDEILVRIDALGICYSDIKVINQGGQHARLRGRDLATDPTVLGHECACTVAAVGDRWRDSFEVGQRYVIQPDIFSQGEGWAFGYAIPGGLAEFSYLDARALDGDEGCYLLPIPSGLGLSQAGLAEPWACVEASYGVPVRTAAIQGKTLVVGELPEDWRATVGGDIRRIKDVPESEPEEKYDTILVANPTPGIVNSLSKSLAKDGVMILAGNAAMPGDVLLDAGAIHYQGWRFVGGGATPADIATAHARADLLPGGNAIFLGGGGPMGQMHVQRALETPDPPARVVITCLSNNRLNHLRKRLEPLAARRGIELKTFAQKDFESVEVFEDALRALAPEGYSDVVVMVAAPGLSDQAVRLAAEDAYINVFAGVQPGTEVVVPLEKLCAGLTLMGASGSRISDMQRVLDKVSDGSLETNGAVAAIGGLSAARDGLEATKNATYPGKIIIYPHVADFPLTPLTELAEKLPEVGKLLSPEGAWTTDAEEAFLEAFEE